MTTSQIAQAILCSNCNYCLKLDGSRGGNIYQYRGCGCLNQYQYTCSSTTTMNGISNVPGFTGSAYCCTGRGCNTAFSSSSLISLILLGVAALLR
ncbi:unnamed protein product, partial [Mesorhabditis belari]